MFRESAVCPISRSNNATADPYLSCASHLLLRDRMGWCRLGSGRGFSRGVGPLIPADIGPFQSRLDRLAREYGVKPIASGHAFGGFSQRNIPVSTGRGIRVCETENLCPCPVPRRAGQRSFGGLLRSRPLRHGPQFYGGRPASGHLRVRLRPGYEIPDSAQCAQHKDRVVHHDGGKMIWSSGRGRSRRHLARQTRLSLQRCDPGSVEAGGAILFPGMARGPRGRFLRAGRRFRSGRRRFRSPLRSWRRRSAAARNWAPGAACREFSRRCPARPPPPWRMARL
jgi:hypothetical protein